MAEHYYGLTDVGRVRTNNEDTFVAQPVQNGRYILAAAIDGVGGYDGGEIAAELAREALEDGLSALFADPRQAMQTAFEQANHNIYIRKQQVNELSSMACVATAALIDVERNIFHYIHVGDTRLYLFRDHSLIKITKDQSFVGFLEDSGRLSETAAMQHPKRNEINKALGFNSSLTGEKDYVESGQSPFLPGDLLLLCSDGLTDMVDRQEIIKVLGNEADLAPKAHQLIDLANQNGGRDNVTVVLVHNYKQPQQHTATKPATAKIQQSVVQAKSKLPSQAPSNSPVKPEIIYKSNKILITVLIALCMVFLAAAVWFYRQTQQNKPLTAAPLPAQDTIRLHQPNPLLAKLQDTIQKMKGDTLQLTEATFASPVMFNDTLKINKDTLYLKGNLKFRADSAYTGPAIVLGPACRRVVINGITLEGFRTGVAVTNDALYLQRVHFIKCTYPVQVAYAVNAAAPISVHVPMLRYQIDTTSTVIKPTLTNAGR